MSRRFIVRPEAEAEMAEAFDWYENRVPGLGSEFLLCVDAVFNAILRSPQQFPQIHKIVRRALTRRFPYEVFFVEDQERIVILSVFHAKRDPKRWREKI
ncbi:MAG: type II toxin-antitoxin system RelE/ParE family toxin [Deltaproteobacteria bacterium]|nr:type II toxin-antitoxin system RelE/ParE family toxin [Deltaproteobacteria bacterium]